MGFMSNKIRNTEAVRIHRPIALGQVRDDIEACVYALVDIVFGENLLPVSRVPLWRAP
jgi:hypothetical protein